MGKQGTSCNIAIERAEKIKAGIIRYMSYGDYGYKNRRQVCRDISDALEIDVNTQTFSNHMHKLKLSFGKLKRVKREEHETFLQNKIRALFISENEVVSLERVSRQFRKEGVKNISLQQNLRRLWEIEKQSFEGRDIGEPNV